MKVIKVLSVVAGITLLTASHCFAVNLAKTDTKDNELYKTYIVKNEEELNFTNGIEKNIEAFGNKYNYDSYSVSENISEDKIDIETSQTYKLNTNNIDEIVSQIENEIPYNQDGYEGKYKLDIQSISIKTNYNGFREVLIEKTVDYTNLEKNDLDFIPKVIEENGKELNLLNVNWIVEKNKKIGEYEVPDTYTASCYYAQKQRIDYPNTYTISANYVGTATKKSSDSKTYILKYIKDVPPTPVEEEKEKINVLPIAGGTTGIFCIILFFLTKNVTVYNYKDGEYKKIGKTRINRNNEISLNRFALFEFSNKYKIELSKSLTNKLTGKLITISKGKAKVKMLVNTNDDKFIVETRV